MHRPLVDRAQTGASGSPNRGDRVSPRALATRLGCMAALLLLAACAGTRGGSLVSSNVAADAASPPMRLVLSVSADPSALTRGVGDALAASFLEQLTRKLRQSGVSAITATDAGAPPPSLPGAVLAHVTLTRIRTGNQALRLTVGFGAGRAILDAHTTLVDPRGVRPIELASWDTHSTTGAMPGPVLGLLPPVATGQAIGIVGGSAGVLLGARETMRKEIDQSTASIADELLRQCQDRGWSTLLPSVRSVLGGPGLPPPRPS